MKKANIGSQANIIPSEEKPGVPDETPSTTDKIASEPEIQKEEITPQETPLVSKHVPEVKYREVVYLGIAKEAERLGAVTGIQYIFNKDEYGMPKGTQIDERDYPGIISEKGKGCARRDPSILFMSKLEWDLEVEQARIANNS